MKISLNWLSRYLPLRLPPKDIQEKLDSIGFEIESVETIGIPLLENVVIGKILSRAQHPNADRLAICTVQIGSDEFQRQIICGATNYSVGDHVPVALPGAQLPNGTKIKKSKLRGETSEGMMCSASELGLGVDGKGLLILEDKPEIGLSINAIFPVEQDTIFDINVTPNRPDCLSHLGIARELSAAFNLNIDYPPIPIQKTDCFGEKRTVLHSVQIEATDHCSYYSAYVIHGVKVGPSPKWMQRLLNNIGLCTINNIVDSTNFILHEYGQPLHAFDAAKIKGAALIVRQAKKGEEMIALNHQRYLLNENTTVIADTERPLAIAGIMGSLDAEIGPDSTDIILEVASFNPSSIRRSARQLGISTDSSYRFERGVDPSGVDDVARRAIGLILEIAGGHLEDPPFVIGEKSFQEKRIQCSPGFICDRLGFSVPDETIKHTFEQLLLKIEEKVVESKVEWEVLIPSFRMDLERPIDLVEEFLRYYGTNNIPKTPLCVESLHRKDDAVAIFQKNTALFLKHHHFNECFNYTTCSNEHLKGSNHTHAIKTAPLDNPLSTDQSQLRYSLIPGLLQTLQFNRNHYNEPQRLFEIGPVFPVKKDHVYELLAVAFLWVQSPMPESWQNPPKPDFYNARDLVDQVLYLAGLSIERKAWTPIEESSLWQKEHAAQAGDFTQSVEAHVGLLHLPLLKNYSMEGILLAGEVLFLPESLREATPRKSYKPFSLYPPISKHLALVVDDAIPAETVLLDLEQIAHSTTNEHFVIESIKLFDFYKGKGLEAGKKSFTFSILFRSNEKTLTDETVNKAFNAIQEKLVAQTEYLIRS